MEATFKFTLPEEETEYKMHVNGAMYNSILIEIKSKLRTCLKYGHTYQTADEALDDIRDFIYELEQDYNAID